MKLSVSNYASIPSIGIAPAHPAIREINLTQSILSYSLTKVAREVSRCLCRRHRFSYRSFVRRGTFHPKYSLCLFRGFLIRLSQSGFCY
ncbi:hypothetical protein ASPTUDRAFT_735389 [Aspergillus tubingensis CBS 134.48]|uniref:Uncharacterized protein n=1 Tax=Aspergillus tubingensis (strain CBS 134.48) TaxID=767770 RepID=A0A1L9MY50_ASPTC|nr:hypothetical protein ASPTUDRAFT_735389 [Aspergillus tubingensis CBS 134.48]